MISEWLAALQYRLGATLDGSMRIVADTSWSAQLQSSERLWMMVEGIHVISLMVFAGTILFVDLRLLGVVLRGTSVSKVADNLLPWTVAGFLLILLTGGALFFSNPLEYYHNFGRKRATKPRPERSTAMRSGTSGSGGNRGKARSFVMGKGRACRTAIGWADKHAGAGY